MKYEVMFTIYRKNILFTSLAFAVNNGNVRVELEN